MEVKIDESTLFDISKICRTCLTEKAEMRSIFMQDESTGHSVILAEMLMGFASVQVCIFLMIIFRIIQNQFN